MNVVTASEMRELDRVSIHERGIPGIRLMEAAGRAVAVGAGDLASPPGDIVVLCGRGNNGGDGFVAARVLALAGYRCEVIFVAGPPADDTDAARALQSLEGTAVRVRPLADLAALLANADVVIDAMLGTGSRLPLSEELAAIIESLNAARVPVVAADLPTGLDADSGEAPLAVRAALTVTMGLPKIGMLSPDGVRCCGRVRIEALEFPPDLLKSFGADRQTLTLPEVAGLLPARPIDGHKGTFGSVGIVAGSPALPGAAVLAAEGAIRSGAGLVGVFAHPSVVRLVLGAHPEVLGRFACDAVAGPAFDQAWDETKSFADALVVGPGLGTSPETSKTVLRILHEWTGPGVLDADGLSILAREGGRMDLRQRWILTPHPGEAARLLGAKVAEVQADRWAAARELARRWNAWVLLKGFGSLVAGPEGPIRHLPTGNTALARGGSGDVLAGLVGGLCAQGQLPGEAVALGGFVHGMAADLAIERKSPRGLRLSDVTRHIPTAFRALESAASPS